MLKLVERAVDSLTPYERNPRRNHAVVDRIVSSIQEFGFTVPLLIESNGNVIDGDLRLKGAKALGLKTVPVILCDGWSPAQIQAFRLLVNRSVTWAEWDNDLLRQELESLQQQHYNLAHTGFDSADLDKLLSVADDPIEDDEDVIPRPTKTPKTKTGDCYAIGPHRLYCGDSTSARSIDQLMQGKQADLVVTDPPYGVDYVGKTDEALTIDNDNLGDDGTKDLIRDAALAWPLKAGGGYYVFSPAGDTETAFRLGLREAQYQLRQCLVWVKHHFVMGRQDYHWRHESILYGWKDGAAHYFHPDFTLDTVLESGAGLDAMTKAQLVELCKVYESALSTTAWQEKRPSANRKHPTMKPIPLLARAIRNSSQRGQLVFDGFAGSGSTIVAAHKLDRVCYAMEKDPVYCDVVVERVQEELGIASKKVAKS